MIFVGAFIAGMIFGVFLFDWENINAIGHLKKEKKKREEYQNAFLAMKIASYERNREQEEVLRYVLDEIVSIKALIDSRKENITYSRIHRLVMYLDEYFKHGIYNKGDK